MIKICTIDLDGTLFDKVKNISKENIEAIKLAKKNGCKIVICTGRPINGVISTLEKLELKQEIKFAAEDLHDLLLEYMQKYGLEYYDKQLFDKLFTPLVELQIDEIF